ncbi:hypothetical protein WA577_001879, partial [Blastocystis sp. JDR]
MIPLLRCIQRRDLSTALARVRRKHKAAIVIGFYGGNYSGMQTNDLKSSIEDKLIGVLYELGKIGFSNVSRPAKFDWERCSRTDKGVSAVKIVVSGKFLDYDDEFLPSFRNLRAVEMLNARLPRDIRVFSYTRVSNGFNPHLNSYSRIYSYYLPLSTLSHVGIRIDTKQLESSLRLFQGTHYMKNYTGSIRHRNKNLRQFYLRTIYSIHTTPITLNNQSLLRIQLKGNSFLYHQIRKMVGAAVAVACGSWSRAYLAAS